MNIGELFVRLTGDTSDFTSKMGGAQRALGNFGKSAEESHAGVGRLNNAFASMAAQVAGVNPVLGKAVEIIGSLAAPGMVVTGAVAGLALIAFAWDQITKSAREASKAQDEAIKRIGQMARMKGAGPGGQTSLDVGVLTGKLDQLRQQRDAMAADIEAHPLLAAGLDQADNLQALDDEIENVSNLLILARKWNQEAITGAEGHASAVKDVVSKYNELRDAAARVNAEILKEKTDWWKGYIDKTNQALTLTEELNRAINADRPSVVEAFRAGLPSLPGEVSMPRVGLDDGLTKEQIKSRDALIGNADKNAGLITGAIMASANAVVGALNIGGGGKGSSLGGALGGTAGFAAGFAIGGPIGGAIGSTVGNIAGSLLGGLFDHNTKATNSNTQALRQLTQAMLLYAPAGFKSESYRYAASDPAPLDAFGRTLRANASRGGANPLLGAT